MPNSSALFGLDPFFLDPLFFGLDPFLGLGFLFLDWIPFIWIGSPLFWIGSPRFWGIGAFSFGLERSNLRSRLDWSVAFGLERSSLDWSVRFRIGVFEFGIGAFAFGLERSRLGLERSSFEFGMISGTLPDACEKYEQRQASECVRSGV